MREAALHLEMKCYIWKWSATSGNEVLSGQENLTLVKSWWRKMPPVGRRAWRLDAACKRDRPHSYNWKVWSATFHAWTLSSWPPSGVRAFESWPSMRLAGCGRVIPEGRSRKDFRAGGGIDIPESSWENMPNESPPSSVWLLMFAHIAFIDQRDEYPRRCLFEAGNILRISEFLSLF